MVDDWITRCTILITGNAVLEEMNTIVVAYIPGELKTGSSADIVENDDENVLRYEVEMLNTLSHRSTLPRHFDRKTGSGL